MDQSSREMWEQSLPDSKIPKLKDMTDFLEQRARALSAGTQPTPNVQRRLDRNRVNAHHAQSTQSKCACCQQNHPLFRCSTFKEMDVKKRTEVVKRNSLCYNCLGAGHSASNCKNQHTCKSCNKRHHTMIHQDFQPKPQPQVATTANVAAHHTLEPNCVGTLATARVRALDSNGLSSFTRNLLDAGSPVSFITTSFAKRLKLKLEPSHTQVSGVGGSSAGMSQATTSFVIKPYYESTTSYTVQVLVLDKITNDIPQIKMDSKEFDHLQNLRLAEPDYCHPAPVDILIGADLFWNIVGCRKIYGRPDTPYGISSTLGYLVAGKCSVPTQHVSAFAVNINLEETVQRFWQAESVPDILLPTKEERDCEESFTQTYRRAEDGRFIVSIPWKSPRPPLGNSKNQAIQRLQSLEKRFQGVGVLDQKKRQTLQHHKEEYIKFMAEYEAMGHMTLVPKEQRPIPAVYISHHFVLKELSTTTKLRVVFDASAKTSSGFSLNDAMMVGPTLQDPIQDIMLRFRKHKIAFTADVEKMYRQIRIDKKDRHMQRILWRNSPSEPIREYNLATVTYGTASAPYLAVKCLQVLAQEEKDNYPVGAQIAMNDFYMDDATSGGSTEKEVIEAIRQLNKMCNKAGFPLRKYSSNSKAVIESIPVELRETSNHVILDSSTSVKTLGIYWDTTNDTYKFTIDLPKDTQKCTKRSILSEVSMIYDPIGWLSPVILRAKLLIQDLWRAKLDWNDDVPIELDRKWKDMKRAFKDIEKITIPRCIIPGNPTKTVLVGFSDSSSFAYSACVYTLCYYDDKSPFSTLVAAKTKVAPMSPPSIPRLELNGALLLAALLRSVRRALKHNFDEVRAYVDSTIVLAWLTSSPLRWKTYVRQRVQKVLDYVPDVKWYHVQSEENCADCASRGLSPDELLSHSLWWQGNQLMMLTDPPPCDLPLEQLFATVKSEETVKVQLHSAQIDRFCHVLAKFSCFRRLLRVTAWMIRFTSNARVSTLNRSMGTLSVAELDMSLSAIIKYIQRSQYDVEISLLEMGKKILTTSKILSLCPFLDANGVLRVGGRLKNANIHSDRKHPMLLPPRHPITRMIIADYHERFFHAGPQLLLSLLQQKFWITNGRDIIRQQVRKCPTCIRHRGETMKQLMGDLPSERVTPTPPFSVCGVDYAGPILTKPPGRSKVVLKSYLAIFVCFSTRALHIEIVESLSTDSFLAALRRFTSRRGRPVEIFSDCGSNFIGANRAIKELVSLCKSTAHNHQVANACSSEGIQWRFNPPSSPHFGGLWETGVRSVKYHLNRVMGSSRYTYEELLTLTTQIEALLNSRPLIPASTDPSDLQALTPAHLLNGGPLTAIPDPDLLGIKEGRLSRWQHIQQQKQHFWKRWSNEYLTRLQQRPKWMQMRDNLKVNDMVIVKEDNLAPSHWRLGRITAVHPGVDGLVRVATVKTAQGEYKRAIHKLCLLPFDQPSITTSASN